MPNPQKSPKMRQRTFLFMKKGLIKQIYER